MLSLLQTSVSQRFALCNKQNKPVSIFWLLRIMLLWMVVYQHLFEFLLSILLDIPKGGSQGNSMFVCFWGTTILISTAATPFAFPLLVHLELIFVCGMRSSPILLHVIASTICWRQWSCPHWKVLVPLLKINWLWMSGFISGLPILFHISLCLSFPRCFWLLHLCSMFYSLQRILQEHLGGSMSVVTQLAPAIFFPFFCMLEIFHNKILGEKMSCLCSYITIQFFKRPSFQTEPAPSSSNPWE